MFDEERFRNLIELGLVNLNHSDRERADRFLRAGAAFVARSVGDDVEIALEFTRETAKLAAARAAVWGAEPEPVRDEDRGQIVPIFSAADVPDTSLFGYRDLPDLMAINAIDFNGARRILEHR